MVWTVLKQSRSVLPKRSCAINSCICDHFYRIDLFLCTSLGVCQFLGEGSSPLASLPLLLFSLLFVYFKIFLLCQGL